MAKKSQIDKAVERLEAKIAVLQLAIDELKAAPVKATRKPRALKGLPSTNAG